MTLRAAIREQLRGDRLALRLAAVLLLSLLLAGLVLHEPWPELLRRLLSPADLRLLLRWGLACLLLLIPIAGIISLVSQYAFWEGWLEGLPEPSALFPATATAPSGTTAGSRDETSGAAAEGGRPGAGQGGGGRRGADQDDGGFQPSSRGSDADVSSEASPSGAGPSGAGPSAAASGGAERDGGDREGSPISGVQESGRVNGPAGTAEDRGQPSPEAGSGGEAGPDAALRMQTPMHLPGPGPVRQIVIYLDGIHQLECDHPPRISAFLDRLVARLPAGSRLLRGLETYTVTPRALVEDSGGTWFWRRLFALQEQHPDGPVQLLAAALVQANNVIKVGISSDRRYGPIRHYELALKLCWRLGETGFRPGDPTELVLLGYSGGAEMAFGAADYLARITRAPVRIISFCGVFSGNHPLDRLSAITTVVGGRDPVAAFGNIAYPGRSPLSPWSRWRLALANGLVNRHCIAGMNHNGESGPFSPDFSPRVVEAILARL